MMVSRGRPPAGAALVEGLEGSPEAKERLRLILETLGGKRSVVAAAAELGIGETAFYKLRSRWLGESLSWLEPRPRGRPRRAREAVEGEEVERLQAENRELSRALRVGAVREELAVAMPWVLERAGKKKLRQRPTSQPGRRRGRS